MNLLLLRCLVLLPLVAPCLPAQGESLFSYDEPARVITSKRLSSSEAHDPHVISGADGPVMAWLEYVPGMGDRIMAGPPGGGVAVPGPLGRRARPTLVVDARGGTWLTYEAEGPSGWDIFARERLADAKWAEPRAVSTATGVDINHRVASDGQGGLWFVWQGDRGGQFDVVVRHLLPDGAWGPEEVLGSNPRGDWHPALSVRDDGDVCVVWDRYDGRNFGVLAAWRGAKGWDRIVSVAEGPGFEGRADVVCSKAGTWVLWEEGGGNWGHPYRSLDLVWNNSSDHVGPLHRLRRLKLARLTRAGGVVPLGDPLPLPSFDRGRARSKPRADVEGLGVYYERGRLSVDGAGRPWVAYRHYALLQSGCTDPVKHHIEEGWQVHLRCLTAQGWSPVCALDAPQRDGLQRLSLSPLPDGVLAAWSVGRTDRRKERAGGRGVAWAAVRHASGSAPAPAQRGARPITPWTTSPPAPPPAPATVGGVRHQVFFGDLHRHTDLSLCFPFFDGSLDDAYRYGIEVAGLDFLGVTDHTRDIDNGNVQSQLWWRSTKEVRRHALGGTFFPYFAFERSHKDTDHNVISLRDDRLRNFPPPLPTYWAELANDPDTFTIPHNPFIGKVWDYQDERLRPLLEIYQGFRDQDSMKAAHRGLDKGYHMGFIASSDHLSTSASYACVWSPAADPVAIFRSLQARRTYGATAPIRLLVRSGDHWMGERFETAQAPTLQMEVEGTGPLHEIAVIQDGKRSVQWAMAGAQTHRVSLKLEASDPGEHYVYVHVVQRDGNQAWSSPLWFTVKP